MLSRHQSSSTPEARLKALSGVVSSITRRSCQYCGAVALASASTCAMAITAGDINFNGYARSGIGGSAPGGDQLCFKAAGAPSKYRLGNECDTYTELEFGATLYDQDNVKFDLGTNVAHSTAQTGDSDTTDTYLKELYVTAAGVLGEAMPEAALWAGKRFYRQHEVHMMDFKYWNISGPGVGIENIGLGFADFSVAWVRNENSVNYYDDQGANSSSATIPTEILDFRLSDITLKDHLSLDVGLNYGKGRPADKINSPNVNNKDKYNRDGWMLTGELVWSLGNKDHNTLTVQYATDAMTGPGVGATGTNNLQTVEWFEGSKMARVFDHGSIRFTDQLDMMYVLGWTQVKYDKVYQGLDGKKTDWYTAGIRPVWKWTDLTSTAIELGYDKLKNVQSSYITTSPAATFQSDSPFNSKLLKFTIAQMFHPDFGNSIRPQLRVFATYAKWNGPDKFIQGTDSAPCDNNKAACNALGLNYEGINTSGQQVMNTFDDKRDGWTYGAQMEVWW